MNSLREQKVINSALWAAAGDAIGWISELTDENGLKRRIDDTYLLKPVSWNRKIGGYSGVTVTLPAGTYSDDTQLRLAVTRSIRNNGEFDTESFAKIELPVWLSYALGAGRATKLAATNLMRKDTNWFSNFYKKDNIEYTNSGGNGTAMRIQPHVWSCKNLVGRQYVSSVIKDSLTTHGSLLAVCGAILHADSLQYALLNDRPASPSELEKMIDNFMLLPDVINNIYELKNFWLPNWESISGKVLRQEVERIKNETQELLKESINSSNKKIDPLDKYKSAISALDCDNEKRRGTATNTALASSLLCFFFKDSKPYEAIVSCVNVLGTDTDSIASMAGAILGTYNNLPQWDIQDSKYIISEAIRLNKISENINTNNFNYPNINKWQPPQTQSDTLVQNEQGIFHILGLGKISTINSVEWQTKVHSWKWVQFEFGQTILVKSKIGDVKIAESNQLRINDASRYDSTSNIESATASHKEKAEFKYEQNRFDYEFESDNPKDLDLNYITSLIIKNGFDEKEIGHYLVKLADRKDLESCIAFSAIIAKAFISRKRK
ncbi:ADP-ribosylglycohydrolase family protein [Pantoea eucalypti]|uniref:ADP-ribosylglycohydrolase family protein n=1 Tax=Pantoea eucalypti TaxID=470933 RepID=UPI00289B7908|nr:ADP-ribosylglycohydrolase family protein [Pantoea eucalypti]